jgi:hypothetical protein
MRTLNDILIAVNAYVDLEASAPTGDELVFRANLANQAVWDASGVSQFSEFDEVYEVDPATNATIPLPSNFREFKTNPRQNVNGTWVEYPEILPEQRYNHGPSEKYCYVLGNPAQGFSAIFNGLEANMTLSFTNQRFPSGLLTLSDVCELSDPTYVVSQTESYILQSRGDDRFPYVDSIASTKLKNLVGRDMKTPGGGYRKTPSSFNNPLNRG